MGITTCVFDAYGTLFDVSAAARAAAREPGRETLARVLEKVSRDWRRKQLEYSWLRAVAGRHASFWDVTRDALGWALAASEVDDAELRERLLALYWELEAYPEVAEMLARLKQDGRATAILSNGSPDMLDGAVSSAEIEEYLDAVLSAEDVGVFKPSDRVYDIVGERFDCARDEVTFVSFNGWDVCAAAGYGFATAWVNRAGAPGDRLWAAPDRILDDLTPIPEILRDA